MGNRANDQREWSDKHPKKGEEGRQSLPNRRQATGKINDLRRVRGGKEGTGVSPPERPISKESQKWETNNLQDQTGGSLNCAKKKKRKNGTWKKMGSREDG